MRRSAPASITVLLRLVRRQDATERSGVRRCHRDDPAAIRRRSDHLLPDVVLEPFDRREAPEAGRVRQSQSLLVFVHRATFCVVRRSRNSATRSDVSKPLSSASVPPGGICSPARSTPESSPETTPEKPLPIGLARIRARPGAGERDPWLPPRRDGAEALIPSGRGLR